MVSPMGIIRVNSINILYLRLHTKKYSVSSHLYHSTEGAWMWTKAVLCLKLYNHGIKMLLVLLPSFY